MANEVTTTTNDLTFDGGAADFLKDFGGGALDNLGTQDLVLPRIKLIQNTSIKGTPGKFTSNISDDEFDNLVVTILNITNFRTMFPEPYNAGDRPLCRSNDGKTKSDPNGAGSGDCSRCQYAVWSRDAQGNSKKPPCTGGYTILALADDGTPCLISIKGASIKPAKQFFTRMKAKGVAPFAYTVVLTSKQEVSTKGRYFVINMDFGQKHEEEFIRFAAEQYRSLLDVMKSDAVMDLGDDEPAATAASAANSFKNDLDATKPVLDDDIPF